MDSHKKISIFTDGACSGNPGPGGWGVLIHYGHHCIELSGGEKATTNNRMEMMAVIRALEWAKNERITTGLTIISDSQYVIKGITEWIFGWIRNGWKTSAKKSVENQDLWQNMWTLTQELGEVHWQWVRGHSGHAENERVDALARAAVGTS
jgi:ribonuclease HI